MRLALPGSTLIHASVLGLALFGLPWGEPEDAAAPAPVTVSIITTTTISTNQTEAVESDATISTVSAGGPVEALQTAPPERLEPVNEVVELQSSDSIEPVATDSVETAESTPVEQTPTEPALSELTTDDALATPTQLASLTPVPSDAIEPVETAELNTAPVPETLSRPRQQEPIVHAPQQRRPPPPPPSTAGNGGQSSADSTAATSSGQQQVSNQGNGGTADTARYKSQVQRRVAAAQRNMSQRGDVVVDFVVQANGQVGALSIAQSSGIAELDAEALALVRRAAPFPPIPAEYGLASMPFRLPLTFGGRR